MTDKDFDNYADGIDAYVKRTNRRVTMVLGFCGILALVAIAVVLFALNQQNERRKYCTTLGFTLVTLDSNQYACLMPDNKLMFIP